MDNTIHEVRTLCDLVQNRSEQDRRPVSDLGIAKEQHLPLGIRELKGEDKTRDVDALIELHREIGSDAHPVRIDPPPVLVDKVGLVLDGVELRRIPQVLVGDVLDDRTSGSGSTSASTSSMPEYITHGAPGKIEAPPECWGENPDRLVALVGPASCVVKLGNYACYGSAGAMLAGFNFNLVAGDRYVEASGNSGGTFEVDGGGIVVAGGDLDGMRYRSTRPNHYRLGQQASCEPS